MKAAVSPSGLSFALPLALLLLAAALSGRGPWPSPVPAAAAAEAPDRSQPPAPGPVPAFQVPVPERFPLSNGLPVLVLERHQVPIADVVLVVRTGASSDPSGLAGVASWTAGLLTEGAAGKNALAFADAVDYLGARLTSDADWDQSVITLHVPTARLDAAVALMADAALRPDFPAAEWDRLRARRQTEFLEMRDDPRSLAQLAMARALFGSSHRYGTIVKGTAAALRKAKIQDLREFHRQWYRPDNAFLVVAGDVEPGALRALLEKTLGPWKAEGPLSAPRAPKPPEPIAKREIILVDRPGAPQSVLGVVGFAPADLKPFSAPDEVMNTLLGGSFTSRLNQNLREAHGYTYGVRSMLDPRRHAACFLLRTSVGTAVTAPALKEIVGELDRIRTPATEAEVERARSYLALNVPGRFESGADAAQVWALAEVMGVEANRVAGYMGAVMSVDAAGLMGAAERDIIPAQLRYVVVGDRAQVAAPLRDLGLGPVRSWTVNDLLGPAPKEPKE